MTSPDLEPLDYEARTHDIVVSVRPYYLDDKSSPDANHFVWAYHVRILNDGDTVVQLLTRHWRITDALGNIREVRGDGVVGKQPLLEPGEYFEYASGTPLGTATGFMVGSYRMKTAAGECFDVAIPAFSLDSPHARSAVH